VKRQTFSPYKFESENKEDETLLTREQAIELVMDCSQRFDAFVSTTGFTSREVYEFRTRRGQSVKQDFLCVGSMGYAAAIAQGVAMSKPSRQVFCLDGDGGFLMHMGVPASIGTSGLHNLKHVVFNNGKHDSVGGQPTIGFDIDLPGIASSCGYKTVINAEAPEDIKAALVKLREAEGPAMLHIKCRTDTRKDLGRPTSSPVENKTQFMDFLRH
jgi:phosphonopyruvate decarboxylase